MLDAPLMLLACETGPHSISGSLLLLVLIGCIPIGYVLFLRWYNGPRRR
jgi:hypothetical protein